MANIGEMSGPKQWAALLLGAVVLTAALYFTVFKTQREANAASQQKLDTKLRENAELEAYRPKLAEIERQRQFETTARNRAAHRARRKRSRWLHADAERGSSQGGH